MKIRPETIHLSKNVCNKLTVNQTICRSLSFDFISSCATLNYSLLFWNEERNFSRLLCKSRLLHFHIFIYSPMCRRPVGESASPQQRAPCGDNTRHQWDLPGAQTSGGSRESALSEDGHRVNRRHKIHCCRIMHSIPACSEDCSSIFNSQGGSHLANDVGGFM